MMDIDLIISHPLHLDYPLHRQFIHDNRQRFNRVIVVFTDMKTDAGDYRQFIKDAMAADNIIFVDNLPVAADQDWRNIAVNKALDYSHAKWVWFTEQDFIITDDQVFWTMVECAADGNERFVPEDEVIGVLQDTRLHPCCLFIKRAVLEKTSKDFGIVKDRLDHFGRIQEELEALKVRTTYIGDGWNHLNGLSQNMYMLQTGEEPNYNPPEFKEYCRQCLEIKPLHPDFETLFHQYIEK